MEDMIRGLRCGLPPYAINHILQSLSLEPCRFYIPWCETAETSSQILPKSRRGFFASDTDLQEMAHQAIWELELQLYPSDGEKCCIETYEDFTNSACICCLIYYDCGWLDAYVKDASLFKQIWNELLTLNAEDLTVLTSENDSREVLHL